MGIFTQLVYIWDRFCKNSSTIIKQYYNSFTKLHCHILFIDSAKVTKVEEIPNTNDQLLNIMQMKVVVFFAN